jgi:outer membrane immunogenic protein
MKTSLLGLSVIGALIAGPAAAADLGMPLKAPAPIAAPSYNWSGLYLGIEGGGAWGSTQSIDADPANINLGRPITNSFGVSGGLFGGTIGYNWQFNNWVAGVEGDLSWVDKTGSASDIPPFNTVTGNTITERWLGTGRVRFGVTPVDRWLVYATGGFAGAGVQDTVNAPGIVVSQTQSRWGWTAGGGIEAAIGRNWSLKVEYLFVGLQNATYIDPPMTTPAGGTIVTRTVTMNDNVFRAGINYRFDFGGPVATRY